MHIEVLGDETISRQARTYAEYRLFAALSHAVDTDRVRQARLILSRTADPGVCDAVSCTVIVDAEGADTFRLRATGDHPYAAINRAVDRLRERADWFSGDDAVRPAHAAAE
jgi:ribosome-associated translation inhibitor RaiA